MDEPIFDAKRSPSSAEPENKTLRAMKQCFEENATTLKQVHANLAYKPHTRSGKEAPTNCCAAHTHGNANKGIVNIVPKWDYARLWEGEKRIYAEVPLKGKGMHLAAYVQSGNKKKVYLANNLLMLTQDKETGEIHYYVVTALANLSKYGSSPRREKLFQFVGNADFDGIAIYSRTDGTFTKALHIHDGKSHPIFFGKPSPATKATGRATDTGTEGSTVTLTSKLLSYDGPEIGGGVQEEAVCKCSPCLCVNCPGNKAYCAICGNYYDISLGTCPNNCGVVITPGEGGDTGGGGWIPDYKTCPYCNLQYDPLLNSCPFGCEDRCSKCGQAPCQCTENDHICERCGSKYCPGPWNCGAGGGGNQGNEGSQPIVASKAKKLFQNTDMSEADWKKLEKLIDKIIKECMGENLYKELSTLLNGNPIFFQFTSAYEATYNAQEHTIKFNKDMNSNELFHEIMHAYQRQKDKSLEDFSNATINHEIEAHYAQYLYLKKDTAEYNISNWKLGVKGRNKRILHITHLEDYIDNKGNLLPETFIDLLDTHIEYNLIPTFKTDKNYKNYIYNKNYNSLANFENLRNITKDC
ncbi:hypothetical protein AB9N12_00510 [Bacteroides sp. AN502(2024)]|uniref:hypothetical protein n=1 Tax=Bacteroides sp. AN502(2024) TaxID=3160599 RepID=UPI003511830D